MAATYMFLSPRVGLVGCFLLGQAPAHFPRHSFEAQYLLGFFIPTFSRCTRVSVYFSRFVCELKMSGSRDEEKRSLRRAFSDGRSGADDGSIHSFASSPTLTPSPFSPALEDDKGFLLLSPSSPGFDKNIPLFAAKQTHPQTRSWLQTPLAPKGITILILRILYFLLVPLLPSPLQALLPADPAKPRILRKIHATSYLDGLRGVAALIVLHSHFLTNWFYPLRSGYLNTESDTHLLQLPILRLLYAGRASVAVFSSSPASYYRINRSYSRGPRTTALYYKPSLPPSSVVVSDYGSRSCLEHSSQRY